MNKEYEYLCVPICRWAEDTQNKLNAYARDGWRVICSYAFDNRWIILEREKTK